MNIKSLHQKVLLVSLALAILSLFSGFFSAARTKEGLFVDTRYESHAQLHHAITGFQVEQIAYNRTGIIDRRVESFPPDNPSRVVAIAFILALLTGAIGAVWNSRPGAITSVLIGIVGLIAIYAVIQIELAPEDIRLRTPGASFSYDAGFYLAIVALLGYIIGGIVACKRGAALLPATGAKRFCGNCGADATNAGKFCGSCGAAIK